MYIIVLSLLLVISAKFTVQECSISKIQRHQSWLYCKNTNFETFSYEVFQLKTNSQRLLSLTLTDSDFPTIHSFIPLFEFSQIKHFSLISSQVRFIKDGAFEDWTMRTFSLSNNKLSNISFVKTLPETIEDLSLDRNDFEIITNVFSHFGSLSNLDLSNCKIRTIQDDSFSILSENAFINLKNNNLTTLDANFVRGVRLDISSNNLKAIGNKTRPIPFTYLNASHNKIENCCEPFNYHIDLIDFSYNNIKEIKLGHNWVHVSNLILKESSLNSKFDFEALRYVRSNVDLSNNDFPIIRQKMFGDEPSFSFLNLTNSSITQIEAGAFSGLSLDTLNLSWNLITELKNYIFTNSLISNLDLSHGLIEKIEDYTFSGLQLKFNLDLSYNFLKTLSEKVFQNLSDIEYIDLSFNQVKILSNDLFTNCKSLRQVILSNSKIEKIEALVFPESLDEINLENNLIESVNFRIFRKSQIINLNNNSITNLDFSLLYNTPITVLVLSNNDIKMLHDTSVTKTDLNELDLSHSRIYNIHTDSFQGLQNLETLNLSNNCLKKIPQRTFYPTKHLLHLDLSNNKLTEFSREAFSFGNKLQELTITFYDSNISFNTFIALNHLKNLTVLNSKILSLEENSFNGLINLKVLNLENSDINEIKPGAFRGLSSLENIEMVSFFKNQTILKQSIFTGLPALKKLDLGHLSVSIIEPKAFHGLESLEILNLTDNKLKTIRNKTFDGLGALKTLDLSSNQIFALEADAFFGLHNLKELSISDNNVTLIKLGTFQQFPTLERLYLHKNNINKILTGTFSNLKFLLELDLSFNNITKLKMENLMSLSQLTRLDVTGNHLIEISHLEITKFLRYLEFFGINDNKWKCDNLANMLSVFKNHSVHWLSTKSNTFEHENIDGIKCYDICKFFYCADQEEELYDANF